MVKRMFIGGAGLLAFLVIAVGTAQAQDAESILRTTLERYEKRVRGIDDYTITFSFMGQEVTTQMQKRMVDGHPVFLPTDEGAASRAGMNPYRAFPQLAARAELAGTETIDGVKAHALRVDDLEGVDFGMPAQFEGQFRPRTLTLWIDTGEYLLRRMDIEGMVAANGQERPLTMTAVMSDYRTIEGMPHPFRTTIRTEGMMPSGNVSGEEAARAREQLAELDRQMTQMPAEQREMMERMMGSQIEQLRTMIGPEGFGMELVVTDLQVNTGAPSGS